MRYNPFFCKQQQHADYQKAGIAVRIISGDYHQGAVQFPPQRSHHTRFDQNEKTNPNYR